MMNLGYLIRNYTPGDGHTWADEFRWLEAHNGSKLLKLKSDIFVNGIREPILLGDDGRIWDGHHRIWVAQLLGIKEVPVEHAQTITDALGGGND